MKNEQLIIQAERHYDAHNFNELYELATSVCLRNPVEVKSAPDESPDAQLIRKIGARGLGTALTITHHPDIFWFDETEDETGKFITASTRIRESATYAVLADPEVQTKIQAFGEQLLNEAYMSLGGDVWRRIRQFREATSDEEQIAVLQWLDTRINAIQDSGRTKAEAEQDHTEKFYHPIRLSPKVLGQYPHTTTVPTCLAVSILTSSFVAQTGAETMHAGVMSTYKQDDGLTFAEMCSALAFRDDIVLPDQARQRLQARAHTMISQTDGEAFHSATVVKLMSGAWYVIDPNYNASYVMHEQTSPKLSTVYTEIENLSSVAPGIEQAVETGQVGVFDIAKSALSRLVMAELEPEQLAALLQPESVEEFQLAIRDYVRTSIYKAQHPNEVITKYYSAIVEAHEEGILHDFGMRRSTVFDEGFDEAWSAFFLYDEDAQAVLDRVKIDPAYAERRLDDLRALPYVTYLLAMKEYVKIDWHTEHEQYIHGSLEVGMPAYRIGAAVLSDFAAYCGDDLSYSFWSAHWPSIIPLTEHASQVNDRPHEANPHFDNTGWLAQFTLIYDKQNGIIAKSDLFS